MVNPRRILWIEMAFDGRRSRNHGVQNAFPAGAFGILFSPYVKGCPEEATNDAAEAGVSHCQMLHPQQVVVEVPSKKQEHRRRRGVPTPGRRSFSDLSSRRATHSGTGVCYTHHRCWARIGAGDNVTLLRHQIKIERPLFFLCVKQISRRRIPGSIPKCVGLHAWKQLRNQEMCVGKR